MNAARDRAEAPLVVRCDPTEGGWHCTVMIGDDPDATEHQVQVDRETLDDLAPGAEPEDLVRASFEFLLDNEPREAIMRRFELPMIGRFFAGYAEEIRSRLSSS